MVNDVKTLEDGILSGHSRLRECSAAFDVARKRLEEAVDLECKTGRANIGIRGYQFILTPLAREISAKMVEGLVSFSGDIPDDLLSEVNAALDAYSEEVLPVLLQVKSVLTAEKKSYITLVGMTVTEPLLEVDSAYATLYLSLPGKSTLYCCDADLLCGRLGKKGITAFANDSPLGCREELVGEGRKNNASVYLVSAASRIVMGGDAMKYAAGRLQKVFGKRMLRNIDSSLSSMVFEFGEGEAATDEELLARIVRKTSDLLGHASGMEGASGVNPVGKKYN